MFGGNAVEIKIDSAIPALTKFLEEKQANNQNIFDRTKLQRVIYNINLKFAWLTETTSWARLQKW